MFLKTLLDIFLKVSDLKGKKKQLITFTMAISDKKKTKTKQKQKTKTK